MLNPAGDKERGQVCFPTLVDSMCQQPGLLFYSKTSQIMFVSRHIPQLRVKQVITKKNSLLISFLKDPACDDSVAIWKFQKIAF